MDSFSLHLLAAPLRIGEKGIPAVNDDVSLVHQRGDFSNDLVYRLPSLDHDLRLAGLLQGADEFFYRAGRPDIFSPGPSRGEFVSDFGGAIENGDGKTLRFHVENEVLAHHRQTDQANIGLIRAHFRSPLFDGASCATSL